MPYMILGNNYFADIDNRHKPLMPIDYLMSHYTFEGQRIVFESPKSYFWLFNRTSPDIYGPYTMNQLREQLIRQGILLPITLQIYFHLTFYAFVRYNNCSNCFLLSPSYTAVQEAQLLKQKRQPNVFKLKVWWYHKKSISLHLTFYVFVRYIDRKP